MDKSQAPANKVQRVCPAVLRQGTSSLEILAFADPAAGKQIVKGSIEPGETAQDAARRELREESGLTPVGRLHDLGQSQGIEKGEIWNFFLCNLPSLPEEWSHACSDGGSHVFRFFWQPLDAFLGKDWSASAIRAARFVQDRAGRMPPEKLAVFLAGAGNGIAEKIIQLATERGSGKTICPSEVARAIAGNDEKQWRKLMKPVRSEAVRLAGSGQVRITRKGQTIDPQTFKGIYRIGLPVSDE